MFHVHDFFFNVSFSLYHVFVVSTTLLFDEKAQIRFSSIKIYCLYFTVTRSETNVDVTQQYNTVVYLYLSFNAGFKAQL